jgi:hypothetical protein
MKLRYAAATVALALVIIGAWLLATRELSTGAPIGELRLSLVEMGSTISCEGSDCPPLTDSSASQATSTRLAIGRFSLELPGRITVSQFGYEGAVTPGSYRLWPHDPTGVHDLADVWVFTEKSFFSGHNPNARTLDDYRTDYPLPYTFDHEVLVNGAPRRVAGNYSIRIHSTESVTINETPALRQRYSLGFWDLNESGENFFHIGDEISMDEALRYVLFDAEKFIIVTGWKDSEWGIDYVVKNVRLAI